MTFNPITGKPGKLKQDVSNPEDRNRSEELIHAVLNTPKGKELVNLWKKQIVNSPALRGASDVASLNHTLGFLSCLQRFIKIAETPPKKETQK